MAGGVLREALNRIGLIVIAAGLAATGCEQRSTQRHANQPLEPTPEAIATAVNPADFQCLAPEALRTEPVGSEAIWARWRHWAICDYDAAKAAQYLDILVARDDPHALRFKGESLRNRDPIESNRLLRRAERFGWREPTYQNEINKLATPPS